MNHKKSLAVPYSGCYIVFQVMDYGSSHDPLLFAAWNHRGAGKHQNKARRGSGKGSGKAARHPKHKSQKDW